MGNSRWMRNSFVYLLVIVAVAAIFFTVIGNGMAGTEERPLTSILGMAKQGEIDEILVQKQNLTVFRNGQKMFTSEMGEGTDIMDILANGGIDTGPGGVMVRFKNSSGLDSFLRLFLNFLPLIFFGGLILFMMRQAQGSNSQTMSFGRSRARLFVANKPQVSFGDVAGVEEAKEELEEVVEFLKFPERFLSLGARIPTGVLLVGQPGTGKTLLGRAVAGEAAVPFFSISGSDFVEMFVGVGAARVRDLFEQAKRNAPCIVFVDEIDAVGRHRGAGLGGGHDEREQTLNQILVEMDGFDTNTNVIVIAATNRPDILDPALLRPGRFDRRVVLDLPDVVGRKAILEVHSKGKPLAESVDLGIVARHTPGFSGADLANLVNEGALLTARRNKKTIGADEIAESIDRVIAGPERKSRVMSPRNKEITAYHEAGHGLVAWLLPHADPVHKISIVARGSMGGYTRLLPEEDRYLWTRNQFESMLATTMGGRVAEKLTFDEVTTGASNDLEKATQISLKMIKQYGMSDLLGPRTFGRREEMVFLGRTLSEERDYGDKIAEEIDCEVRRLIQEAYDQATKLLVDNKGKLKEIAEYLVQNETVEGDELKRLFGDDGEPPKEPAIAPDPDPAGPTMPTMPPSGSPVLQPNPALSSQREVSLSDINGSSS